MSRIVMRPARQPSASTSSSFCTRASLRIASAASRVVSGEAVTRLLLVIMGPTRLSLEPLRNFMSRRVRMPATRPRLVPSRVTGNPETFCSSISVSALDTLSSGLRVIGSLMTPFSLLLTFATSRAWTEGERVLWMIPIPPSWAKAMAKADSLTVSMGADTSGIFKGMLRLRRVEVSALSGVTSLYSGISRTSSKVTPSWMTLLSIDQ